MGFKTKESQRQEDEAAFLRAVSRKTGSAFAEEPVQGRTRRSKRQRKRRRAIVIPAAIVAFLVGCYLLVAFSSIPFIAFWRGVWIETAMTTGRHQWLATAFFPKSVVEKTMASYTTNSNVIGGMDALKHSDSVLHNPDNNNAVIDNTDTDILGQKNLVVGQPDWAGNTVLVNDIEEGLVISEIRGDSFRGQIIFIDDPSRVFVGTTRYKEETGERILDMMKAYGAVAGTNASGFNDADGNGNGGVLVGLSRSESVDWGYFLPSYSSIVLTTDNKLVVGNIGDWSQYNIRDGIQFYPVLIADGVTRVSGSSGYGIQPRTAVGQRADGAICFLVIDGRDVTWSIGCTVGDMAEILETYQIVNAGCCDGGASSCIAYGGVITTKNCSWNPDKGRILPNAFLVRSKKES